MNDLISRQMLLEYIHGEPVGRLLCDKYNLDGLIEQLPPANCSEFPNSSDTISRAKAIEALNNIEIPRNASWYQYYQQALTAVYKLPPAQPERIKGHWIEHDDGLTACECSVCHEKYNLYEEDVFGRNFCPNCGADMREVTT